MVKRLLGKVSYYYPKIGVAVVEALSDMKVGDSISIEGPETDVKQKIERMEIDRKEVGEVKVGSSVAMKVSGRVRVSDHVYLENEEQ